MQESGEQPVPLEAVPNGQPPSLGARLRNAREGKELRLEKIADELRIDASVLRALEEDRLADIAVAPVFIKGYIKQYSRQLGLDYGELREVYLKQIGNDQVDLLPSQSIRLRDERQITLWIIATLVLLLVGVFLFVWWIGDTGAGARSAGAPAASSVITPRPERPAAAPPSTRPATSPGATSTEAAAGAAASESPRAGQIASPTTIPAVTQEQIAAPASEVPPAPLAVSRSASTGIVAEPGSALITLRFIGQSWAEVTARDDTRIFYDLGAAGTQFSFMATPPVRVLLGNAPGVEILIDDEPFSIPRQGRRGNIANFVISAVSD